MLGAPSSDAEGVAPARRFGWLSRLFPEFLADL
jgi:hypothetical protein